MPKTLPVLYHEGRTGKMYSWKIWTEGAEIVTEYGTVDGEKSLTRKTVKGKNVGKSNETTPEEQALREAAAQHKKKLEAKYSLTPDKAQETVFLPMLAHDLLKMKKPLEYPVDVQCKLEGVRCMVYWGEGGELQLMSRGGKPFVNIPHIKEAIEKWLPLKMVLDGELYVHGMSQQDINRLWKKHRPGPDGTIQLKYYIYDCFERGQEDMPWQDRVQLLCEIVEHTVTCDCVDMLNEQEVQNEAELYEFLESYEEQGYEGIIIRKLNGPYQLGHRSRDLLKLKKFQDDEFRIVGHEEASGNDKGTVIWRCVTKDGAEFTVRPKGTREYRKKLFEEADKYYGRLLTVKFQGWTKDMKPYFPVGVAFREPEDM